MSNETWIQYFKLGKLNIDMANLSNEDKIRFARIDNLLKELIKFYELHKKISVGFDEGRYEFQ